MTEYKVNDELKTVVLYIRADLYLAFKLENSGAHSEWHDTQVPMFQTVDWRYLSYMVATGLLGKLSPELKASAVEYFRCLPKHTERFEELSEVSFTDFREAIWEMGFSEMDDAYPQLFDVVGRIVFDNLKEQHHVISLVHEMDVRTDSDVRNLNYVLDELNKIYAARCEQQINKALSKYALVDSDIVHTYNDFENGYDAAYGNYLKFLAEVYNGR